MGGSSTRPEFIMGIHTVTPPDDTGSDTLRRYRYQAEIAFLFCLQCVCTDLVKSVIVEHFEDLVVEYQDHWYFIQIKTRDAETGPWKLSHTLGRSGGLRSLWRTYNALSNALESTITERCRFGLFLEGSIARQDLLGSMVKGNGRNISGELVDQVSGKINGDRTSVRTFLEVVFVEPDQVTRSAIADRNFRLLVEAAPEADLNRVKDAYEHCIEMVGHAMAAEQIGEHLANVVLGTTQWDSLQQSKMKAKILRRQQLEKPLEIVTRKAYPLLERVGDSTLPPPTVLEEKLLAGEASPENIANAKTLRANAYRELAKLRASQIFSERLDSQLGDLEQRLKVQNGLISSSHGDRGNRVNEILHQTLELYKKDPHSLDPNGLLSADPFHLLGYLYELADRCEITW